MYTYIYKEQPIGFLFILHKLHYELVVVYYNEFDDFNFNFLTYEISKYFDFDFNLLNYILTSIKMRHVGKFLSCMKF